MPEAPSIRTALGGFPDYALIDSGRRCKLERVHARLQLSSTRSVTEVALDHGFMHLGRFSEAYRKRFGELPSQTWKRHR